MAKAQPIHLSNDEYAAELNRRLEAKRDYQPGARFVVRTPGPTAIGAGVTWEGPDTLRQAVMLVVREAAGLFEVDHPFIDRRA